MNKKEKRDILLIKSKKKIYIARKKAVNMYE